ncbi:MAG TPA: hypothetical protein VL134_07960 [Leptolyngbya sp.]|nr:hypothetical protein [Leptolyngbya sp.]
MSDSAKYWNLWQISPSHPSGYRSQPLSIAHAYFEQQFDRSCEDTLLQSALLSQFRESLDVLDRAQAGLCLRCSVSDPILKACKKLENLFGGDRSFTYRDLLPFVLNDDGKRLILLDDDGKTQVVISRSGEACRIAFKTFAVEILRTFKANALNRMSLNNWAYLQTKQNAELRAYLSEFGFQNLSDWALLNRAKLKQLAQLSDRDRAMVEAFHAVYRRDRRSQRATAGSCPDPSMQQLEEMQKQLPLAITPQQVFIALKQIAVQLRQYDIWSYREPLEIKDADSNEYVTRTDLPSSAIDETEIEQQEFLEFLREQLQRVLTQAIEQEIHSMIVNLENSKRYAPFAKKFIPGLQFYYGQSLSLKEIAPLLEMTSWDQARRILNPGELLSRVRSSTLQNLLDVVLKKAEQQGLTQNPPESNYLRSLVEQIEAYADAEVFQAAVEEIRAGKHRSMTSVYAKQILSYIAGRSSQSELKSLQPSSST